MMTGSWHLVIIRREKRLQLFNVAPKNPIRLEIVIQDIVFLIYNKIHANITIYQLNTPELLENWKEGLKDIVEEWLNSGTENEKKKLTQTSMVACGVLGDEF